MGLTIRLAQPEDAAVVARIHIDSWKIAYRGLVPDAFLDGMNYANREAAIKNAIANHQDETYLAKAQGEAVGILTIGTSRDSDLDSTTVGEIWGIYLHPQHWRRGYGRLLVDFAEDSLLRRGNRVIVLWVFEGNSRARRFYEAVGYQPDGAMKIFDRGWELPVMRYRKSFDPTQPRSKTDHQ